MLTVIVSYVTANKWQLLRFSIVGLTTFALNFVLVWLFYGVVGLDYRIAVSIAYTLTIIAHFMLNRSFTYGLVGMPEIPSTIRYAFMLFVNYLILLGVTTATVELLGLTPYFGVIFSEFVTAFSSFLMMKHFVFAQQEKDQCAG